MLSVNYRNRQTKALGGNRLFEDVMTPNLCWAFDVMYLPPSKGYTHLLLGVENLSGYLVLYPLRANTVEEVIKSLTTHLAVILIAELPKTIQGTANIWSEK